MTRDNYTTLSAAAAAAAAAAKSLQSSPTLCDLEQGPEGSPGRVGGVDCGLYPFLLVRSSKCLI